MCWISSEPELGVNLMVDYFNLGADPYYSSPMLALVIVLFGYQQRAESFLQRGSSSAEVG